MSLSIPTRVFIIPYRGRERDKVIFMNHMKTVVLAEQPESSYEMYFAHQKDERPFNRGAMKNIGFLAMKDKYPDHYKDMIFIFNDVDTVPIQKDLIDYYTTAGSVKHYYGFEFALGGIFAITGSDFEKTGGFPNFWGWGLEDNTMYDRCIQRGLIIDRSMFYKPRDPNIKSISCLPTRVISKKDSYVYKFGTPDNMHEIRDLTWTFNEEYIDITSFECRMNHMDQIYDNFDITRPGSARIPIYMPGGNNNNPATNGLRRDWRMFKQR
jgi:hypothetical protein